MRPLRTLALVVAFVLAGALTASAQTIQKISWDQNDPIGAITGFGDSFTLTVDTAAPAPLTVTCASNATDVTKSKCSAPMPTLSVGPHQTFIVTAANVAGSRPSAPLTVNPPSTPSNVNVVITVTVIVGVP